MKTRLITAGVAIVVAVALIVLGSFYSIVVTIALALISALLCGEYLSAKKLNKDIRIFIPCLVFSVLIPLLSTTHQVNEQLLPYFLLAIVLFVLTSSILSVVFHATLKTEDMIFAAAGVLLISLSLSTLNMLVLNDPQHAAFWIVISLGIPWFADSAAYFAGSSFGKRKLCPNISPNKTVEGAMAGVLVGTLIPLLLGFIFKLIYGQITIYYGILVLVGFINSLVSIFGDLTFSVIKRSCKIKDYGSIMPGHGGLLDRFDSFLFCLPLVYIFSQIFYFCV